MWLGYVVPGAPAAARGPHSRLGLRPAAPDGVAPSSSSVSVVEENLHATLQLNTQHTFVGKVRTLERSSRPYLLL
jgi:hypothetical protein